MSAPIRVLFSVRPPRPTTNPYIVTLGRTLAERDDIQLQYFSWRAALLGRWDVLHVHWPEVMLIGRDRPRRAARQVLLLVLLIRMRLTHRPLVRTAHNLAPHEKRRGVESAVLRRLDRQTALWIRLNDTTAVPDPEHAVTILHGDYRERYAVDNAATAPVPGRFVYFGLIRRYKAVDELLRAFAATRTHPGGADLSLHVLGRPEPAELAAELAQAARSDSRVELRAEFVPDAELIAQVAAAELVVLPYRDMHNSGSALAALSMDRPVLMPDNEVNRQLADEVGPAWVRLYIGSITADALTQALAEVRTQRSPHPDLSRREWPLIAEQHALAYGRALAGAGRRYST